jgi:hypothetical protein
VLVWLVSTFLEHAAPLVNDDHAHLLQAELGVLWTAAPAKQNQRTIVGTAEMPSFRGKPWTKARQEYQMREWFGELPDFVLTLSAPYAHFADDASWCALVEHELYHCGVALDEFGGERFRRDGTPIWAIRGHDVEEFVGVVRRYGPGAAAGETLALVEAGARKPEVARARIEGACGVCARAA